MVSHLYLRGPIFSEIKTSHFSSSIFNKLPEATESLGIAYFFFDGRDLRRTTASQQAYSIPHFAAL
jgi:hypothetical protein